MQTVNKTIAIFILWSSAAHGGEYDHGFISPNAAGFSREMNDRLSHIEQDDPLRRCGDPCIISGNSGGYVDAFDHAWQTLQDRKKKTVIIDGRCDSGCVTFAAFARSRGAGVCVTPSAYMRVHKTLYGPDPEMTHDLDRWFRQHGGYPPNGSGRFTTMVWPTTSQFWKSCASPARPARSVKRPEQTTGQQTPQYGIFFNGGGARL